MFKFNEITSDDMNVIVEDELNFLRKAAMRNETIEIESKDGAEYNELGFSNIEIPLKLQLLDKSKLDDILSWLNGKGKLEYKNRYCYAYSYAELNPIRYGGIYTIDLTLIREPFWTTVDDYTEYTDSIVNNGNIPSKPLIKLIKNSSDVVEISINDTRFKYTFDNEEEVIINCKTYNAEYNGFFKNNNLEIGFEFPVLNPGTNKIILHEGDCNIYFKDKDWYL